MEPDADLAAIGRLIGDTNRARIRACGLQRPTELT